MTAATDVVAPTKVHEKYADRRADRFVEALNETSRGDVTWNRDIRCDSLVWEIMRAAAED